MYRIPQHSQYSNRTATSMIFNPAYNPLTRHFIQSLFNRYPTALYNHYHSYHVHTLYGVQIQK